MLENPLNNRNDVEKRKRLASYVKLLTQYFERWKLVFPTHEVSKEQLAVYLEAVKDLSINELGVGCREVIKTALTFPKPAEIIIAAKANYGEALSGPPLLEYPPISEDEREEALKFSEKLKETLLLEKPKLEPPAKKRIAHVTKPIEQQKAELRKRGYLQ
jgi:hypothetical protein